MVHTVCRVVMVTNLVLEYSYNQPASFWLIQDLLLYNTMRKHLVLFLNNETKNKNIKQHIKALSQGEFNA